MSDALAGPTPDPEVNALLAQLLASVRAILGDQFVGMYLEGSLATGVFDQDSDVDFVVVTHPEISASQFSALQAMHTRLATLDTPWAIQLEGSYLSRHAVRRHVPGETLHANLERGLGERLKLAEHGRGWAVHRWLLRERGLTVAGPAPQTLIDPVTPDELRQGVREDLQRWATPMLDGPASLPRGYQSYIVLTLFRMLYTLETGSVATKPAAVRWASQTLGERWRPLIEDAWDGRHNNQRAASSEEMAATRDFIRFALLSGR